MLIRAAAVWCRIGLRVGCARWVFPPFSLSPNPPDLLEPLLKKKTTRCTLVAKEKRAKAVAQAQAVQVQDPSLAFHTNK